jgi:hypothetical protein
MTNTLHSKVAAMLQIQATLNASLFENWTERGLKWHDAIMIEATELFDHTNWKWWKKAKPVDMGQINMEAVDILHFLLSQRLDWEGFEDAALFLTEEFYQLNHGLEMLALQNSQLPDIYLDEVQEDAKLLINAASAFTEDGGKVEVIGSLEDISESYFNLLFSLHLDLETLYKLYIGKVQLNRLRWNNGYGSTYIKDWGTKESPLEDNQWLTGFIETLDVDDPQFVGLVYQGLEEQYNKVKAGISLELSVQG